MSDWTFERELENLAATTSFPETPSLTGSVLAAIGGRPTRLRRRFIPAVAVAAVIAITVLVLPGPRAAVARLLGLGGITIEQVATFELPAAEPTGVAFGQPTTLDEVPALVGFEPVLPALPGFPEPEVFVDTESAGGLVTLVYPTGDGSPALIVTQFRTTAEAAIKQLDPDASFREVFVGTGRGIWIEGGQHSIAFVDSNGLVREDRARLVGNTLIWVNDGTTFRFESNLPVERVVEIAESMTSADG